MVPVTNPFTVRTFNGYRFQRGAAFAAGLVAPPKISALRLYRPDARLRPSPQRALSHRRQGSQLGAHPSFPVVPLTPWHHGRLRAASWSFSILRSPPPAFCQVPSRGRPLLCRRRLYRSADGFIYSVFRGTDGRRAFLQLRGRNRCGFVDADHRRRHLFHPKRKSPAAPAVDDPQLRRRHRLPRSACRRRRDRLGKAAPLRNRNHSLDVRRFLPAFRGHTPSVAARLPPPRSLPPPPPPLPLPPPTPPS